MKTSMNPTHSSTTEPSVSPENNTTYLALLTEWPWLKPILSLIAFAIVILLGLRFGMSVALLILAGFMLMFVLLFTFRTVLAALPHEGDANIQEETFFSETSSAQHRKQAALKAIKDLEYEKSIGNVNPDDYLELMARYRQEAKEALRAVDEERKKKRAAAERLAQQAIATSSVSTLHEEAKSTEPLVCIKCSTINDLDAKFCKKCGTIITAAIGFATQ